MVEQASLVVAQAAIGVSYNREESHVEVEVGARMLALRVS